ncbi:hypothetical protein [Thermophilibacter mediterraneus]|uniref:hypothetical protein n=1 Tax=Thermophilibacter mediterraneus TaxID=1871031 RepID=UPI0009308759|nr:hypothetical protein [Thermophilibacter mediterraneus]
MSDSYVELFRIDATPVGDSRYPMGTEAKVFSADGELVAKVNGEVVARLPKSYESQIRSEKDKRIELGARIGDTISVSVMVPASRAYAADFVTSAPLSESEKRSLRKHGLAFEDMSDVDLSRSNVRDIRDMDSKMAGSGLYSLGSLLSGNADTSFMIDLMKAQIRQQWVIVRQNEQIIRLLRDIAGDGAHSTSRSGGSDDIMTKMSAKASGGTFVSIGDDLTFRGTFLMKGGSVASKLTPEQRDTVIKAIEAGGSRIFVLNVDGDDLTIAVSR